MHWRADEIMDELIEIYSEKGKKIGIKDEKTVHTEMIKEFFRTGKVSTKHKHSKVLIFTPKGKVILQKRAKYGEQENSGLWDKTVGGHVQNNESFDFAIIRECAEELQIATTIVDKKKLKYTLDSINLRKMAVLFLEEINKNDVSVRRLKNSQFWDEPAITAYYLGYYDGPIKFKSEEISGFRVSTLNEIEEEMKNNPNLFTKDLFYILGKWKHRIESMEGLK